jgi:NADPH-dependent 2,4-dienoyl-CoA reductase/sulfur reductase-like enzyme
MYCPWTVPDAQSSGRVAKPLALDIPVVITGAGPVGLSLACELERLGTDFRIVDAAPERGVVARATDLAFRCEPPDAGWLADRLSALGVRVPAARSQ